MKPRPVYAEVLIRADIDRVWSLTQDPMQHPRWDQWFSSITPVSVLSSGTTRFRYSRSIPFHTIEGVGTSLGEVVRPDGTRTSALRFDTGDRWSPLREGRGCWRYVPTVDGVR